MLFRRKEPLLRDYVSEIDRFLKECDQSPGASSESRRAEESKYRVIGKKQTDKDAEEPTKLWDDM